MTRLIILMASILLLSACTTAPPPTTNTMHERHVYCRTHAREFTGEADEEGRYKGCILMQGRHDVEVTAGE